jgi:hypothetical protein
VRRRRKNSVESWLCPATAFSSGIDPCPCMNSTYNENELWPIGTEEIVTLVTEDKENIYDK